MSAPTRGTATTVAMDSGDLPQARLTRRVLEGSLRYLAVSVLRAMLGMVVALAVARSFGEDGFGRWTLLTTWAATLTMFSDVGTGTFLTREVARERRLGPALSAAAVLVRASVLATAGLVATGLAMWVVDDPEVAGALRVAWVLALCGAVYGCVAAVLRGIERLDALLAIETVGVVCQAVGTFGLLASGRATPEDLLWVAVWAQLVQVTVALVLWRPTLAAFSTGLQPLISRARHTLTGALPFAGLGLLAQVQLRWTPLALGALGGEAQVGLFTAAARMTDAVKLVPQAVFGAALPVWSAEGAGPRTNGPETRAGSARPSPRARRLIVASAPTAIALAWLGPALLQPLLGPAFVPAGGALVWLSLALPLWLHNGISRVRLMAAGRESLVVRATAATLGIQLATSIPLMAAFGAKGAGLSVCLGEAVLCWFLLRLR